MQTRSIRGSGEPVWVIALLKCATPFLARSDPSVVKRILAYIRGLPCPLELGPPVGWPVQYRVSGPDVNEVRDIALRLAQVVSSDSRVRRVNFDWMEPSRKVRIRVD